MQTFLQQCGTCRQQIPLSKEPMIPTPLSKDPWERLGSDLFELHGKRYVLIAKYYSYYPEVIRLTSTTSASVITSMKSIFPVMGYHIRTVINDNGPQYNSTEIKSLPVSMDLTMLPQVHVTHKIMDLQRGWLSQ